MVVVVVVVVMAGLQVLVVLDSTGLHSGAWLAVNLGEEVVEVEVSARIMLALTLA
jgi:hypothetical protein